MSITLAQLQSWMDSKEDEHLEFKEAKNNFHFEKLVKYCAALANEGGGTIILGVTDKKPRRVVGSQIFLDLERTKAGIIERLRLRIEADELAHADGRVLVFRSPGHSLGVPVGYEGAYWMRAGEDLVPMTPDMLKRIFEEAAPDFSAEICSGADLGDLDPAAIDRFRGLWIAQSENQALTALSDEQLLRDAELIATEGVTYAAIVVLGTNQALGQHLDQAEVVFEYRSDERSGPANQRENFRQGFLLFYDKLWEVINLRNDLQSYQDGLVIRDIRTFNERAVREALLNAVGHRDYRHPGSVFVRQYPRRIEIESPGGFPQGITATNIIDQQQPRNRRIAQTFERCDFIERSGQGADRMFEESIKESKSFPDFSKTDADHVRVTFHGEIHDPAFVAFWNHLGQDLLQQLDTHDFITLSLIAREQKLSDAEKSRLQRLLDLRVVERIARGKFLLSKRFYDFSKRPGVYTRKRGLDREQNKALLLKHIENNKAAGCPLQDLMDVVPSLTRRQVQGLLTELREGHQAHKTGQTKAGRWYPGPAAS